MSWFQKQCSFALLSTSAIIDNNKKPSFTYEFILSNSIFEPEIFNSKTKRIRINKSSFIVAESMHGSIVAS